MYFCAIAGALAAFMGLGALFGGGMSLPRFTDIHVGTAELAWLLPLAFVGAAAGWLFCVFDGLFERAAGKMGDRPVAVSYTHLSLADKPLVHRDELIVFE